jgi:hypothetical protein
MNYGWNAGSRKPPAPVTIADPVTVGKVAALVDHVPPPPSGTYNCPFADEMACLRRPEPSLIHRLVGDVPLR